MRFHFPGFGILCVCFSLLSIVESQAEDSLALNVPIMAYNCFTCHGDRGISQGAAPSLHKLPAKYIRQTLLEYRADRRPGTIMPRISKGFSPQELNALANYIAQLP
ncbi:c-type cytochrome [Candidatus Venteria ishoeyi]|uniref:Cytochrome subunit of sulfide dehydrogenase n=1 Tax=Candidatus Venteria ishoeyi TaxID=1899563 RepID=A0A1H6FJC0_9GAMM|nr:c-type cytochrome [Candidatus Venteria ishoeyi]SEH09114.1 Cytochrome subunit of sulfide dehydrogenase [Candidatus Venteria ishoeyi]